MTGAHWSSVWPLTGTITTLATSPATGDREREGAQPAGP